jgi:hypothetical protein
MAAATNLNLDAWLIPAGTAEQQMMLHERVVKLEQQVDGQQAQLRDFLARLTLLETQTYQADKDNFSDGSFIDWFVWEPLSTVHVGGRGLGPRPMTDMYWNASVILPFIGGEQVSDLTMRVPVSRDQSAVRSIKLPRHGLTVRRLLETLHGFYATHITTADLADRDDEEPGDDPYLDDARDKLAKGEPLCWSIWALAASASPTRKLR